jgi:hypothetical protein
MSSRLLSSRASAVLSALGIPIDKPISGVYDGRWGGTGPEVESRCPATGEVIGRIKTVSPNKVSYPSRSMTSEDDLIPGYRIRGSSSYTSLP